MKFFLALIGAVFGQFFSNHLNDAPTFPGISLPGKFKLFQSALLSMISDTLKFLFLYHHFGNLDYFYLIILALLAFN